MKQHDLGVSAADLARKLGIAEPTFYRWKKQYRGLESDLNSGERHGPAFAPIERSKPNPI